MAYGHRLNLEDIFFDLAEQHFKAASLLAGKVRHEDADGVDDSFRGYPTDKGLAAVSIAVVGWATSLEAFVNLAWNSSIAPTLPEGKIRKTVMRSLSTKDKLHEVLLFHGVDPCNFEWWPNIQALYSLRNELVHYKHEVTYQGFSFAPRIAIRLAEKTILEVREAAISAVRELGKHGDLRTGFVDGDYEIETVNA